MNISQGFCTPKGHMPLSFVPYSGILNCSQHVGQHGYDARLVSNLLVLITVPVGLAFSASIIFGIVSSSRIRILHMKLVLCVSAGDGFYQFGKLILNICDILKEAGPANPFSPESSLFVWIKQFGLYFGFSWHTAIITSVFLLGRYPVLFLKPKHESRIFAISCAAVWSLTLFMAGFLYFNNDLGIKQGFHLEPIGWSARFLAVLYALGLLWAVFVIIYSVRKLGLRLMGIGQAGRTKSVVFLMAVVIMYYAPNLLPLVLAEVSICERTAFTGALQLLLLMSPVSAALSTFIVWRRYVVNISHKGTPQVGAESSAISEKEGMGMSSSLTTSSDAPNWEEHHLVR